jgi:hypothetical protein
MSFHVDVSLLQSSSVLSCIWIYLSIPRCDFCDMKFTSEAELETHCRSDLHKKKITSDEDGRWRYRYPPRGLSSEEYTLGLSILTSFSISCSAYVVSCRCFSLAIFICSFLYLNLSFHSSSSSDEKKIVICFYFKYSLMFSWQKRLSCYWK